MSILDLAAFALLLAASGAAIGVAMGLLGVGGGALAPPLMFFALQSAEFPPTVLAQTAIGSALAVSALIAISSTAVHHRAGAVDWKMVRDWGGLLAFGAVLGALVASAVGGAVGGAWLILAYLAAALAIAIRLAMRVGSSGVDVAPLNAFGPAPASRALRAVWAVMGGAGSVLAGLGGGAFGAAILAAHEVSGQRAVATAAAFGVAIAAPGAIGFAAMGALASPDQPWFAIGYVSWPAVLIATPLAALCAPIGAQLARDLPYRIGHAALAAAIAAGAFGMLREGLGG